MLEKFKLKFSYIFFSIMLVLFLFFSCFCYSTAVSRDLSSKVLRLHIVANSDSFSDQILKLKVRDALFSYFNSIVDTSMSRDEILKIAKENIPEFTEIAEKTIYENNENYKVSATVGNFYFPTKAYGSIVLPARKLWRFKCENWLWKWT